ncbi:hypothetical protein N1851_028720 [Merluccius polli]|uniref:UPAR/Ly6 domain-containing protein n=1 Tax=Merluccius polli TaxID=89951 RepID=A0AA47M862_MERPO|nr:hypothetical protein N1851_028720 [Merluccius polli]
MNMRLFNTKDVACREPQPLPRRQGDSPRLCARLRCSSSGVQGLEAGGRRPVSTSSMLLSQGSRGLEQYQVEQGNEVTRSTVLVACDLVVAVAIAIQGREHDAEGASPLAEEDEQVMPQRLLGEEEASVHASQVHILQEQRAQRQGVSLQRSIGAVGEMDPAISQISPSPAHRHITMRFCGFFVVLCLTISTVWGLTCYECVVSTEPCSTVSTCETVPLIPLDRCFSLIARDRLAIGHTGQIPGLTAKGCISSSLCISPITCCEGDLCNNAKYIGPSFFLMVLSSAALYFL